MPVCLLQCSRYLAVRSCTAAVLLDKLGVVEGNCCFPNIIWNELFYLPFAGLGDGIVFVFKFPVDFGSALDLAVDLTLDVEHDLEFAGLDIL